MNQFKVNCKVEQTAHQCVCLVVGIVIPGWCEGGARGGINSGARAGIPGPLQSARGSHPVVVVGWAQVTG